jgi:hypothetical protein
MKAIDHATVLAGMCEVGSGLPARERGGTMRETELRRLLVEEFLSLVEDPRVEPTRKHSLGTILASAVSGGGS